MSDTSGDTREEATEAILTAEECQEGWNLRDDGRLVFLYKGEQLRAVLSRPAVTRWRIKEIIDHERGLPPQVSPR